MKLGAQMFLARHVDVNDFTDTSGTFEHNQQTAPTRLLMNLCATALIHGVSERRALEKPDLRSRWSAGGT